MTDGFSGYQGTFSFLDSPDIRDDDLYDTEFLVIEDDDQPLSGRPTSPAKARVVTSNAIDVENILCEDSENLGPKLQFPLFKEVFLLNQFMSNDTKQDATKLSEEQYKSVLRNGGDVVKFFMRFGDRTALKFVFCNFEAGPRDDPFRPYDLKVVERSQINPEYVTISASGVTIVHPKNPTETLTLARWTHESTIFSILRSLNTFKFYKVRRAFNIWKKNVHAQFFKAQRRKVSRKLFLTRKSFGKYLIKLNSYMVDLQAVEVYFSKSKKKTNPIDQFETMQVAQQKEAILRCIEISDKIKKLVEEVVDGVRERARQNALRKKIKPSKSMSIVKAKQLVAKRRHQLRVSNEEAARLGDFIRLVDYMVVSNLCKLAVDSHALFVDSLLAPGRSTSAVRTGIIHTIVSFSLESADLTFSTTQEDTERVSKTISKGIVEVVNTVPLLHNQQAFKPLLLNSANKDPDETQFVRGPDLEHMILSSEKYTSNEKSLMETIEKEFNDCLKQSQQFLEYREVFDKHREWDFEAYAQAAMNNVNQLSKDITQQKMWESRIKEMIPQLNCGMFHCDSKAMKESLQPMVDSILQDIYKLIQKQFRTRCTKALEMFRALPKKLNNSVKNVEDFAHHVEMRNNVKETDAKEARKANEVCEMLQLIVTENRISLPVADSVLKADLEKAIEAYETCIVKTDLSIRDEMASNVDALSKEAGQVTADLQVLETYLQGGIYVSSDTSPEEALEGLHRIKAQMDALSERIDVIRDHQTLFGKDKQDFKVLKKALDQYAKTESFWVLYSTFKTSAEGWMGNNFKEMNVEEVNSDVNSFYKDAYSFMKKGKGTNRAELTIKLKEEVEIWKNDMQIILDLGNRAMLDKHWSDLYEKCGGVYDERTPITLTELYELGVIKRKEMVGETVAWAVGEYGLQRALTELESGWKQMEFTVMNYRDIENLYILGDVEEIMTLLDDNQVTLQTMMASRYIKCIRTEVETWTKTLSLLGDVMEEWLLCQRNWMYLENIFGAADIQKQLPVEAKKFREVDRAWKKLMTDVHNKPNVIHTISMDSILENLQGSNRDLDRIQKSLELYLESKRLAFPRFYFLSNDELLSILANTREPQTVQPHIRKCFDAVKELIFSEVEEEAKPEESEEEDEEEDFENEDLDVHSEEELPSAKPVPVVGLFSVEREELTFSEPSMAFGPVETWIKKIELMIARTVRDCVRTGLQKYPEDGCDRNEWIFQGPAQCCLAVDQIMWTKEATDAIAKMQNGEKDALDEFFKFSLKQIDTMVELVRGNLTKLQRRRMSALIVLDVHGRDVMQKLVEIGCSSLNDFNWTKCLRYYWDTEEEHVKVRQTNACFTYGYEYIGNCGRLVITPLTDVCYLTLTGAIHLKCGGAPAGPAGTGKTETVKDLAKALAIQCVVFNCSEGLNVNMMGQFFSGLAACGAWACFDEFNRINIEVLSVIAQQLLTISECLKAEREILNFDGRQLPMNPNFGVFITMNPGYAGRTELPDNLKSLFRPVAMMVPDYALIAEIILFSEGFETATVLSKKMVQLYKLSSEQLSKQDHYDFGMRAVKSVLVMAGSLRRAEPELSEEILLIRAMRDSNVPKFLSLDLPLFYGILKDLFPSVNVPYVDYGKLQLAIEHELELAGLQKAPSFIKKIIQMHETMIVRHGMMLVGPTGSGKTTCATILAKALEQLYKDGEEHQFYKPVHRHILNPKSVTMEQLYGCFNEVTREWTPGLVAKLVRDACEDTSNVRHWNIFDGPVDALWIENMNTVLDDNKTLCLANGERIKLTPRIAMVFEVEDLSVASPATVSRCGMVYMESQFIGWKSLVESWRPKLEQTLPSMADYVVETLYQYIEPTLKQMKRSCRQIVPCVDFNLVQSCIDLISIMFTAENGMDNELPESMLKPIVDALLWFSFVWSFGSNIHDDSRDSFSRFLRQQLKFCEVPKEGTVWDYALKMENSSPVFLKWSQRMEDFSYDPSIPYFNILVPTADTTRYKYFLQALTTREKHMLLMAETGCGKTVIIQEYLKNAGEAIVSTPVIFSAQTTARNLQDVLESKLEKKSRRLLGAPAGKKMVFFIDDLNMPQKEEYGAQPPIELLRQAIDQGGFYDLEKLTLKLLEDLVFVAACAPPGGGRNSVTPRLTRHFHMFWQCALSEESLKHIFTQIACGFLSVNAPDLVSNGASLVNASVEMYTRIETQLLPTPSKSHYTFNLRDLSKVFQGVTAAHPSQVASRDHILRLWLHESQRVFRDRLVDNDDRTFFNNICKDMLSTHFDGLEMEVEDFQDLMFANFLQDDIADRVYERVDDKLPTVIDKLDECLEEYNNTYSNKMNLVFFKDAIGHICRISRIICQPRGNALCVGVGGSGRQSLTRLATMIAGYQCFAIEITRTYNELEWREDLKKLLMMAGADNQPVVFLFSDTQIVKESFLEDINNILNAGEVPSLFANEELEAIFAKVRPLCKKAGKLETRENIYGHFVQLVRENLHIVLAFSPIGDGFRSRCRKFPALVNCCTINWFSPWPAEALYSVAQKFLKQKETELQIAEYRDDLCRMCVEIQESVFRATERYYNECKRHNYVTPTSYLELINLYISMLQEQRQILSEKILKYTGGLTKLQEAEEVVSKLQIDLKELQPTLDKASKEVSELLVVLEKDKADAEVAREACQEDAAACQEVTAKVDVIRKDCQADLDLALPAYHAAVKALDTLKKEDITMVKSFNNPPPLVALCLEAVCLLFGQKPNWDSSKKLISKMSFLPDCKNFDKDNIDKKTKKKLQKYIKNPDFNPDAMKSVSSAATSLCMWVTAIDTYSKVAAGIEPKKLALAEAEAKLKEAQDKLNAKMSALKEVEDRVASLQRKFDGAIAKKNDLEAQKAKTCAQLERAEQLVGGLASEKVRWQETADQLKKDRDNLVGNMVLAAGCVAYLGVFTADFRKDLMQEWITAFNQETNVSVDQNFSILRIMGDPVEMREWQLATLPADDHSSENGMFVTRGRRWPLMIDPQEQAVRWIKQMEKKNNIQVIKLSQSNYLRTLENAIRYGQPCLLENVEETLDPALEPILQKQIFKKGGQWLIRLGDQDVPYSKEFKFYIATKLPNPHYMPEIFIKVTMINFTVTPQGLEDQLLVTVCGLERPDLEEKNDRLIVSIANDKKQLAEIEDQILSLLAKSEGDILDNKELISTLGQSKKTSTTVKQRMAEAESTVKEIRQAREGYREVASLGSTLYFVIASLANVDPMYQYSLLYFTKLYKFRIKKTEKSDDLKTRINILLSDLKEAFYNNICRGLFEKDKLMFSFLIAAQIAKHKGEISNALWNFFLVGPRASDDNAPNPDDDAKWLSQKAWEQVCGLNDLEEFEGFQESFEEDLMSWEQWVASEEPLTCIPEPWNSKLSSFASTVLIKSLREAHTMSAVKAYVIKVCGPKFVQPPPFDIESAFQDSTPTTPIIFVLSSGADPMSYLMKLAQGKGLTAENGRFNFISLGQGQGPVASSLMKTGKQNGQWVCLQNCHLFVSWFPTLERLLEQTSQDADNIDPDYRLWLTSMPSKKFPVAVLQNSIKITMEPPRGIKANLKGTYLDVSEEEYNLCTKKQEYKKLFFGLAFFHAIIQERRKFGAIGWNIPYSWMNSDLQTSKAQLRMYLDEQAELPLETLNYIIGEVNYGGRITDDKDQRCCRCILSKYMCENTVIDDNYKFSSSDTYFAPPAGELTSMIEYIEQLPLDDTPETFGLHPNAEITFQQQEARGFMTTIRNINPAGSGGGSSNDADETVLELCSSIVDRLPEVLDIERGHKDTFAKIADGSVNSLGIFLQQEAVRFNRLLEVMAKSLSDLENAIKGLVVMSSELETMFQCFLFNLVPPAWENAAYPSLKPLASWYEDLIARVEFMEDWLSNGPPDSYWVSGFFFPQGFMTGVLQLSARNTQIPIDSLSFRTTVFDCPPDDINEVPETGVLIHGLFLQGCGWDNVEGKLVESSRGELFTPMPVIWLEPTQGKITYDVEHTYDCPVYKTSLRRGELSTTGHSTNFVLFLTLPAHTTADHLTRQGVALLTQLDD